ncbi:hypothetical protein BsWGS_26578 [Bradybaena similaris]
MTEGTLNQCNTCFLKCKHFVKRYAGLFPSCNVRLNLKMATAQPNLDGRKKIQENDVADMMLSHYTLSVEVPPPPPLAFFPLSSSLTSINFCNDGLRKKITCRLSREISLDRGLKTQDCSEKLGRLAPN